MTNPNFRSETTLAITFWGVRGSNQVSGPEHLVFGGNTMCLEIEAGNSHLIIDAGSGIRALGRKLVDRGVRKADILLTHFHLDHLIGLTAFAPLFHEKMEVTLYLPTLHGLDTGLLLDRLFGPPFFPVTLKQAGAQFSLRSFGPRDTLAISGLHVLTAPLDHPGGACGYRIEHAGRSIAVITDHEPGRVDGDMALATFCKGADMLLYDAHWDADVDYQAHRGWGHSTWQAGVQLLKDSGAGQLFCVHHAPEATDSELIAREHRLRSDHRNCFFAREGERLIVGAAPAR